MYQYAFEKLSAWIEAKELTKMIYSTTEFIPSDERYRLLSQLKKCAISVCSNLAEGSARRTKNDQAHFSTIAYGSTVEMLNQIILAYELGILDVDQYTRIRKQIEKVSFMIAALRKSQLKT